MTKELGSEGEGPLSEFGQRLLAAARNERPGPELSRRMAEQLNLPLPALDLSPIAATPAPLTGWLAVAAVVVVGGGLGLWAYQALHAPSTRVAVQAPAVAASALPNRVAEARAAVSEASQAIDTAPASTIPEVSASGAPKPVAPVTPPERGDLREEIRLIDAARAAVAARSSTQALSLLRRYSVSYPGGTFGQEAAVLRMEALEQSGQRDKARALARDFLSRHAGSPLAERVARVANR